MTDVLSPEQRRRNMSAIRGKNTKPELFVRSMVHRMGFRYRLHRRDLPGTPDLFFPSRRKIIFVNGCFWHMHACPYGKVLPKTNSEFWAQKRLANKQRDSKTIEALNKAGFQVLTVWECQIRDADQLRSTLTRFLSVDCER